MKKLIFIIFLIVFTVFILPANKILALTANEVRQQIEETNNQIEALDKQIKQYQQQITQTSQEKDTLAKLIKELTLTRNKLVTEKEQTQKKINATDLVIQELNSNITTQEKSIQNSKDSLSRMLADIYISDNYSFAERLLSQNSLAEASNEYNNILAINEKIKEHLKEVRTQKEVLLVSKDQKETEQGKLQSLKQNLTLQQQAVEATKKEKDKVLTETKNKEAEYQRILAEQIKRRDSFEKAIADYEAQLQFILNPKLLPKEGSGVLSWPLSSILITSPYGSRWGTFHYGVDFRAAVGTSVFAMASGIVEGTGDTDIDCKGASFGKWIFIKYNNGLSSTFGHLSVISVKEGQSVKAGDVVGLSGNTGSSTGPHLHVSVYASTGVKVETVPSKSCGSKIFTQPISALNAYLNPMLYLPKVIASMIK
jgi:murein DD-endopeptidase MepM/ murein hydrolase activator NlpD